MFRSLKPRAAWSAVLPRLYVGGAGVAGNEEFMADHGIALIINCAPDLPNRCLGIPHLDCPVEDDPDADIAAHFPETFAAISRVLKCERGAVLVHCQAGVSRSPTIVIAFLMKQCHISYIKAFVQVLKVRDQVTPNRGFVQQLKAYQAELGIDENT